MSRTVSSSVILLIAMTGAPAMPDTRADEQPVAIVFDTDVGNDIDDALALAMLHAYCDRGTVKLLAVTLSKDNPWAAAFVDAVNTFYGRPDVPIGVVSGGKTPEEGKYLRPVASRMRDGRLVYPHDLKSGSEAPEAVDLQRRILATQPDGSVVFVVVGFSTNLARLLESPPDAFSPLSGRELVRRKVRLLSIMAGNYANPTKKEYNVYIDEPAARTVFDHWPTEVVASGYEIGDRVRYPASSIENDFDYVTDHPVAEAYRLYNRMPYDRPCWDLTSVLVAVEPDGEYFGRSDKGAIRVEDGGFTSFKRKENGRHRYLTVTSEQIEKTRRRLVELVSSPPGTAAK